MKTINLEEWLADTNVEDFDTEDEIIEYFSEENLHSMFGKNADLETALLVQDWCRRLYRICGLI
jgi:hypothetical protein